MSSNVSPLIYKKLNLKNENSDDSIQLFYDKNVKKIVLLTNNEILIYNKRGDQLKKRIQYVRSEVIRCLSLDKLLRFVVLSNQTNSLTLVNLDKPNSQLISVDSKILNTFFINVNCCPNTSHNETVRLCVVTESKMIFYRINHLEKDKISEISKVKISNTKSCSYNSTFIVLVIEKPEFLFDFYNLANEKFYSKPFEYALPLKKARKSSFNSFFSFSKKENKPIEKTGKLRRKTLFYKQNQFFLEKLYKKLYFIVINFEESEVQIHLISQLNNIKRVKTIPFDNTKTISLQIIDNLVVLHFFDSAESIYFDIKIDYISNRFTLTSEEIFLYNKKQEIINSRIEFDEDDERNDTFKLVLNYNLVDHIPMNSRENKVFYNLELEICGQLIKDILYNDLYIIYFDSEVFYTCSSIKSEGLNFILRRKHSSETIYTGIYELLQTKYSFNNIIKLFQKISKRMNKRMKLKASSKEKVCVNYQLITGPYDIIKPIFYLTFNSGDDIPQYNLYEKVFKLLSFRANADMSYLLKSLLQLKNAFIQYNITLEEGFFSLIISYFKRLENKSLLYDFFQFRSVPDNIHIARFLMTCAIKEKIIVDYTCFHYSLDIFTRLKNNDEILKIFIDLGLEDETIRFIKKMKNIKGVLQCEYIEKLLEFVDFREILDEMNR